MVVFSGTNNNPTIKNWYFSVQRGCSAPSVIIMTKYKNGLT